MTPNDYVQRHDRVGQDIHWKMCQHYNASYAKNWQKHKLQKVVETESATTLWDFFIHTDRTMQANKPDITMKDHKEKTCKLIDFKFSMDVNISAKIFRLRQKECGN